MPSALNILALDSSGADLSVALTTVHAEIADKPASVIRSGTQSHDEGMASALDELFQRTSKRPESISAVVVGSGPGSFTGLRISLAFGKGLSFSLKVPLILLPSAFGAAAAFWAHASTRSYKRVLVIAKAGKDQYFLSDIECSSFPHDSCAPRTASREEAVSFALAAASTAFVCLDPAIQRELPELSFIVGPLNLAEGLLGVLSRKAQVTSWDLVLKESAYSLEHCATAEPNYVRSVAAKTIAERILGDR